MTSSPELSQILEAVIFAAIKHQGQVRKDERGSPYVTHPLMVAQTLWDVGGVRNTRTLIAAILHDTLEDTKTTSEEISARFGEKVLAIILEVTDDKSLEKMDRKRLQVVHAPDLSRAAKIIKLGDKLVNCHDILFSPPKDWSLERRRDYIQWSADVVAKIRGTNPNLERVFDAMLQEAEELLDYSIQSFKSVNQRPWGPTQDHPTQEE